MAYKPGQFPALSFSQQAAPGSSPTPQPVQPMTPPPAQAAPADPVGGKPAPVRKNNWFDNIMENPWVQGAALGASFIPVIGTAANAAFQGVDMARNLANGDRGKAMANAAFMVPGVGAAAKLGKGAVMGAKAVQGANAASKAVGAYKGAQTAAQGIKATQQAQAAAKTAELAAKGITRGRAANFGINAAKETAKLLPGVGVAAYGYNNHNNEQRHQTLMDQYNANVEEYVNRSPLHRLHYERSQQGQPAQAQQPQANNGRRPIYGVGSATGNPYERSLQSQAGNLQPWGSQ